MNLKFEEFQKSNLCFKELNNIRIKSFKNFETQGLPTKKQEHWKYTDIRNIISNNFEDLQIFNKNKDSHYNNELLVKDFEHNKIILLNGKFIESNFTFENEEKIELTVNDISNFLKKIFLQYNLEKFSVNISLNHEIINLNQPYNIKNGDELTLKYGLYNPTKIN